MTVKRLRGGEAILLFFSLVLVVGCTSGSNLVGVPNPAPGPAGRTGGSSSLPATDAGLAEHAPQQLIIRFLPGASTQTILQEINGTELGQLKAFNATVVGLPQGASIVDAIRKVQAMSGVKYAEPNYIYRALQCSPPGCPNDTFFATKQWGPQKINAPAAWATDTGSSTSVIAIIDTGVSVTSVEFTGTGKLLTGTNCVTVGGTTNDDNGHGTHVAGIAAAPGNDNNGIAGISWLSPVLPIKVLDSTGQGTAAQVACGLNFAANFAVATPADRVVANMSLGGAGYSQTLKDAVDLAISDNVVVIAAAGNDGKATVFFPAGFPGVMAVGATDPTNTRASFSTYGPQLSVVAPGVDIYSTLSTSGPLSSPTGFGFLSGTSMAAPHVAGVAALVRAANPGFTVFQVRSKIEQTACNPAASASACNPPTPTSTFNPQFGWGLVNAGAAIGTTVTNNYGSVQVTVTKALVPTAGVDVVIWVSTTGCSGLTQFVETTQTTSTGVAVFSQVPIGSYCATASQGGATPAKGSTTSPFAVAAGPPPTAVTVQIM